jgi:hypothetical protein
MKRLDLVRLRRDGALRSGAASTLRWSCGGEETGSIGIVTTGDALRLIYRARNGDGCWFDVDEMVRFHVTKPAFGGERLWFACPGCSRRCQVLFGGARFRCRRCHGLRYSSQAETRADWATRAMFKIVRQLDPTAEFNDLPPKPKGMHWRTYERLAERYAAYDDQWAIRQCGASAFGSKPEQPRQLIGEERPSSAHGPQARL